MSGPELIAAVAASSAITTLYHHVAGTAAETRARRASCDHLWGANTEVAPPSALGIGSRERYYKRFCERCGEQLDTDEHGNPYVPRRLRK